MKRSALAILFCAVMASASFAQEQATPSTNATVQLAEQKAIDLSAVPAGVQTALKKTAYKLEDVTDVYELTVDNEKQYKFIINAGQEKRAVTFDAKGTMTEDEKAEN